MFNRFSREEQSRARHSGGSGLGLSIARAICQAHGGSISASLPETGGLAVTFCYPGRRLRWKIAALDNTLTKRRIFLD
jgi:signal transduction histidine kinase